MSRDRTAAGPGRRAIVRWAWRMFRRDWRQQVLVLSLVIVAVGAAVAGSTMAVNAASRNHGFGHADALVRIDAEDPARAAAVVDAVRARFGEAEVIGHELLRIPGYAEPLDLRSQDPGGVFSGPLMALRDGRFPTADDEIALTPAVAAELSVEVGDRVELGRRTWTLVGEVENPSTLSEDFALVAPDHRATARSLTVLVDRHQQGPATAVDPGAAAGPAAPQFRIMARGDDHNAVLALVLIVVTLAMSLTALIAAAGFVVVAQRRQRQLGLLAALGATERHLRLVMLANGLIVGVVAAVAGSALGLAGWFVAAAAVERAAGHRIDRFDLPWGVLAACLALAVVASSAAAWWPARSMARMPVMAALARRPLRPVPVHRSLMLASALLGGGVVAIGAARPTGEARPILLVVGVVAVVTGVVLVAPAAIRALAVPAARLPFAPRLALRDLVRYQARASSALAAIALGLGVSVAVLVLAQANEARPHEGNLSDRQLLVHRDLEDLAQPVPAAVEAAVAELATALGQGPLLPLEVALKPAAAAGTGVPEPIEVSTPIDRGYRSVGPAYVATPEVLAHYGIDPDTIDPATDLLTSLDRDDLVVVDLSKRLEGDEATTVVQRADLSTHSAAPRALLTDRALQEHGWEAVPGAWLVETDHPLTDEQVSDARTIAGQAGLDVLARDDQDSLASLRTASTAVGVLLALAIVAMAIGLLRSESAQDLQTLTATGATARTRRAVTATTACSLAVLGVVLSVVGAYAAIAAGYRSDLRRLSPVPVTDLLTVAVGLPVAAAAIGWLLAGRDPQTFARQTLD